MTSPDSTYFLTFGSVHPEQLAGIDDRIDHQGWVEVHAPNMEAARNLIVSQYGTSWSFCYTADEFNFDLAKRDRHYPKGRLFTLRVVTEEATA